MSRAELMETGSKLLELAKKHESLNLATLAATYLILANDAKGVSEAGKVFGRNNTRTKSRILIALNAYTSSKLFKQGIPDLRKIMLAVKSQSAMARAISELKAANLSPA